MSFFQTWADARKIKRLLEDYPVYHPPFPGAVDTLTLENGRRNYEYFLENKEKRRDALRAFLSSYDVPLEFTDAGLAAVDTWVERYSGHLLTQKSYVNTPAFMRFVREWTGTLRGLNVIWDLGTYAGDFIIKINPECYWMFGEGTRVWKDSYSYLTPCISLPYERNPHSVFESLILNVELRRSILKGSTIHMPPKYFELSIVRYVAIPHPDQISDEDFDCDNP